MADVGGAVPATLQVIAADPELTVAQGRLALGIIDPEGGPLLDGALTVYLGRDANKPPEQTATARYLRDGVDAKGIYIADVSFPSPGTWLIAGVVRPKEGAPSKGGTQVQVLAKATGVGPGDKAPSIKTPTTARPFDADPVCSRKPKACGMHRISLDEALRSGRPTVLTFSAPSFCETETCGPVVEILDRLDAPNVNFIHVEAYRGKGKVLTPALSTYRLKTEPWTFFIDRKGVVVDRIGGAFATEEATQRLAQITS